VRSMKIASFIKTKSSGNRCCNIAGIRWRLHASVAVSTRSRTWSWCRSRICYFTGKQGARYSGRRATAEWWRYCHSELCQAGQKVCAFMCPSANL